VVVRLRNWVVLSAPIWSLENKPSAVVREPAELRRRHASACVVVNA